MSKTINMPEDAIQQTLFPEWPIHVKAPFQRLIDAENEAYSDASSALLVIQKIEQAKRDVMIAWAECTTDRNPGMLDNVLSGMLYLSPYARKHIEDCLAACTDNISH